jgi:hypothetical protein
MNLNAELASNVCSDLLKRCNIPRAECDVSTFSRQRERRRASQALAGSGYQRNTILQTRVHLETIFHSMAHGYAAPVRSAKSIFFKNMICPRW